MKEPKQNNSNKTNWKEEKKKEKESTLQFDPAFS